MTVGRTHGVHAEPTTFGLKMALMFDEFGRALERLETLKPRVAIGKLSGAVGTNAHLSPKIESFVCRKLGLKAAPIATQVVQRDIHAEFMTTVALVGASIELEPGQVHVLPLEPRAALALAAAMATAMGSPCSSIICEPE